jgi:Cd2+/Zn2+-exporting ATPase
MIPDASFGTTQQPRPQRKVNPLNPITTGFILSGLTLAGVIGSVIAETNNAEALMWACYTVAGLAGGLPSAQVAISTLWQERKLNVDLLMVVAAIGAASVGQTRDGAILLFLFSLSNTLQAWAMGRTRQSIEALMKLHPDTTTVIRDNREVRVPIEHLQPNEVAVVKPGERFPADGTVLEGYSSVDESAITGESVPRDIGAGENVLSGTLNGSGVIHLKVERTAQESTLDKLIRLVEDARAAKSPTETFAARLEGPYTIFVLFSVPVVYLIAHFVFGLESGAAWYRAMTFLVVASPCAVVISTPAAVLSAMAAGARHGVLFKSGAALEVLSRVRTVAMDKTGTLTEGRMRVMQVIALKGDENQAKLLAASLERHSEHPVGQAIVQMAGKTTPLEIESVRAEHGKGIVGQFGNSTVWAGNRRLASGMHADQSAVLTQLELLEQDGHTVVIVGRDSTPLALIALADEARSEARDAIHSLHRAGLRVAMLTGDRHAPTARIANALNVDDVRAELLPEEKLVVIAGLRASGLVAMVGDGVNDAPALSAADVGISMGSGSDAALESADVVLMRNDLSCVAGAIRLAQSTDRTVKFNLSFALSIIVVVGAFALAGRIPLPFGVIAHEGGTVFVCLIGLRLLFHPVRA